MNCSAKSLAAACGSALLLACATLPASAAYLGYGNGDPGNWDFWTEQKSGHAVNTGMQSEAPAPHKKAVHRAHHQIHNEGAKETKAS
jgi:hypothetical protein